MKEVRGIWLFSLLIMIFFGNYVIIIFNVNFFMGDKMNNNIIIKGAKENNLKNIDLTIPRDKLVVITGLSGSRKIFFGI